LPGDHGRPLYPEISPVNSFRVVFNEYLGTSLPLLPDRTLRHRSDFQPLAFDDVTAVVAGPEGRALSARLESSPPR
jgi:hypothetical protein